MPAEIPCAKMEFVQNDFYSVSSIKQPEPFPASFLRLFVFIFKCLNFPPSFAHGFCAAV